MQSNAGRPRNVQSMLNGWNDDGLYHLSGTTPPTDGAAGTGVTQKCGKGSLYFDVTTGFLYKNIGTAASPTWRLSGGEETAEVTLTNAQVLNLRAAPITMVAAPGAGKVIQFLAAMLFFDFTAAYTAGAGDDLAFKYNNGAGVAVSDTIEATGFLTAAADTITSSRAKIDGIASKAGSENLPLVLHNVGGAEFGGGNAANVVRVVVSYNIIPTLF